MNAPRLHHVPCLNSVGLHRVAYWEWGDPANPRVLVCVHGLTRQGRDFDVLAAAMSEHYRVVCPDVAGRGESDRLPNPLEYIVPRYAADMVTVLARLKAETVHWVGTSMGGLIGMVVASFGPQPLISKLVMNDVGPVLPPDAIARIGAYLGVPKRWDTVNEAVGYLWSIAKSFGPHTPAQWMALSRPMLRPVSSTPMPTHGATQGVAGWQLHYDPAIAIPFQISTPESAGVFEQSLWTAYDAVTCPTLLLRGADSDLLTAAHAQAMTQRGPRPRLHEFAGVGHAPTLVADDQVRAVREFLLAS